MFRRAPFIPFLTLLLVASVTCASGPDPAGSTREILSRFDKGSPGWKVRMECLVRLAKAGPGVVPLLVEALQRGSPSVRAFAAQALAALADSRARPALTRALDDPSQAVRIYAVRGLSRLGPVKLTDEQRRRIEAKAHWMLRHYISSVLIRKHPPDPKAVRQALASYDLSRMGTARLGRMAPDFALKDVDGKTHRLSAFRGKIVLLEFNVGDD
jgi:hypothetical protein